MNIYSQQKPLFVPFQKPTSVINPALQKKYFIRAVITSLTAFLIAVTLVSFATNRYEEKLREIQATPATCQAVNSTDKQTATAN